MGLLQGINRTRTDAILRGISCRWIPAFAGKTAASECVNVRRFMLRALDASLRWQDDNET
jgi:hypothetical protein